MHLIEPNTHNMIYGYHAREEEGLAQPVATTAEVEREIEQDEWEFLITGNGGWDPRQRTASRRRPMLDESPDD